MGHAAGLWVASEQVETVAVATRGAIPDHWRGRAARNYDRTAANIATGLSMLATRTEEAARLAHRHDTEVAATRAALATGGPVAV